jgi:hypothetical protein
MYFKRLRMVEFLKVVNTIADEDQKKIMSKLIIPWEGTIISGSSYCKRIMENADFMEKQMKLAPQLKRKPKSASIVNPREDISEDN